jgi:hypothetical protein
MEELLHTIEPSGSSELSTILIAIFVALGAAAATFALLRTSATGGQRSRILAGAMLLFFLFLISSSTAFFSWLKMQKVGPVKIYRHAVETPYGKAAFQDIKNIYIHLDQQPSRINPNQARRQTRLLVIEERQGKAHLLSEEDYDIMEVMAKLKKAMGR